VFLGVYPRPVLERMEPSVDRLIQHVEQRTDYRQPTVAVSGKRAGSANGEARP
jgi:hypothetical protein